MIAFFESETSWLTVTNIALGVVTLAALVAVARTVVLEIADRVRAKERVPVWQDDHAFVLSNLGITMADGGEPIDEQKLAQKQPKGNAAKPEDPAAGSK